MRVRVVLVAGFVLLFVLLAVTLAQTAPRSAGSNLVPEIEEVVELRGTARHCQDGETVPGDAAALLLLIGTYGRPAPDLEVMVRDGGGRPVTSGRLPGGGPEGRVTIPIREVDEIEAEARACVRASGRGRTVLYGAGGRIRLEWERAGDTSWFALIPTIAHRLSLGKWNPLGDLLLPALGLVMLATWWGAAGLLLREVEQ